MRQMVNKLSCKVGVGGVWHVPFISALGMGNETELATFEAMNGFAYETVDIF